MQPSPRLFNLIQSLTPSEKRYFQLFAQRHKKGNSNLYLKLFQAIHQQKAYNEPALKEQFTGTSFGKNLAFPKSNLYDQVLRSLQSFHFEKSNQALFRSALDKIELLIQRGLHQQGLRILNKTLPQAEKLEFSSMILQMIRLKRELLLRLQGPNVLSAVALLSGQEQAWEQIFQDEQLAIRLRDSVLIILQEVRRKTQIKNEAHLLNIRKELDALHNSESISFQGKVALYQADAHYYHLTDDFPKVHTAYDALVNFWDQHPHQISDNPDRHANAISAWLYSKILIGEVDEALEEIRKWRGQEGLKESQAAKIFKTTYPLELFTYLNSKQFAKGIALSPEIASGVKKYKRYLSPNIQLALYYNMVIMHLLGNQPTGGLHWVNQILIMDAGEIRKDIQTIAPLFEKILHYESGNLDLLDSWFRSLDYRRKKKSSVSQMENIFARLIKSLLEETSSTSDCYRRFLEELKAYSKLPKVSKTGLQEMEMWVEGKT